MTATSTVTTTRARTNAASTSTTTRGLLPVVANIAIAVGLVGLAAGACLFFTSKGAGTGARADRVVVTPQVGSNAGGVSASAVW